MTNSKPTTWRTYVGQILFCLLIIGLLYYLLEPVVRSIRNIYLRQDRHAHMHAIGKAVRLAQEQPAGLAQCISSPNGCPLLSWRVAILPYLQDPEALKLYKRFKLDEPWDGPSNRLLLDSIPACFTSPGVDLARGHTLFKVFVSASNYENGKYRPLWSYNTILKLNCDFPSQTILFAEVGEPIPWTKPEDLAIGPEIDDNVTPLPFALTGYFPSDYRMSDSLFNVCMADGSVRTLRQPSKSTVKLVLRRLIGRQDGEDIDNETFD